MGTPEEAGSCRAIEPAAGAAIGRVAFGAPWGYLHAYPASGAGAPPKAPAAMTVRNRGCASNGKEAPGFPVDLGGALPVPADAGETAIFCSPMPVTPSADPYKRRPLLIVGAAS